MFLQSFLTTIPRPDDRPVKVAELGFRPGTKVTIPYLDSRTCSIPDLDMHEEVVRELFEFDDDGLVVRDKTLELALKVYYRSRIVFHGPLSAPRFDYDTGKIELVAHDPSLRLKRAFLNATDIAVTDGITLDGEGLLQLLDSAQNTDAQDALNWPALGIIRGRDTTSDYSDKLTKLQRGDNIWESGIKQLADSIVGPDFVLRPIETDPAELASGTDIWDTGGTIVDAATTDYTLDVTRTGDIGGLRLAIYAEHERPRDVRINLIHPDGTSIRLYTGSRDKVASGTDFLGTSGDFCVFKPGGANIYASAESYPHTEIYRGDRSLGAFYDKAAAGTWTLRIEDTTANSDDGTLHEWRLIFDLPPSAYCRMDVSDKPDTSDPDAIAPVCIFHKGHGEDNAKVLAVTPQGDLVRNQFIADSRAGRAIRVDDASRADYGTYQGWDSPGDGHSLDYLKNWADAQVGAYGRPIPALELAPVDDAGDNETLRYGEDFELGAHVRAIGKRGNSYHDITGRITEVVLTQGKSAVECDLTVEPLAATEGDLGDG